MSRTLRPLAALAMVALLSAGCSNATAETGTGSSGGNKNAATAPAQTGSGSSGGSNATNRDQAVKFAECMRKRGCIKVRATKCKVSPAIGGYACLAK